MANDPPHIRHAWSRFGRDSTGVPAGPQDGDPASLLSAITPTATPADPKDIAALLGSLYPGSSAADTAPAEAAPAAGPAGETPDSGTPTPPEPDEAPRIVSRSGKRVYPRFEMPASAEIDGVRYAMSNWSLGGFGLAGAGPHLDKGAVVRALLVFEFDAMAVSVDCTCTVVRLEGTAAVGFQFLGMTVDKARVLREMAEQWLAGDLAPGRLMGASRAPQQPDETEKARIGRIMRTVSRARTALLVGGTILATLIAIVAIAMVLLTVRSDFAAVVLNSVTVRAPIDGVVTLDAPKTGESVAAGRRLAMIEPGQVARDRVAIDTRIGLLEGRLARQQAQLRTAESNLQIMQLAAAAELADAQKRREAVERELEAQTRLQAGIAAGRIGGAAAERASAESLARIVALERVVGLERELSDARLSETRLRQRLAGLRDGVFGADGRAEVESPAALRAAIDDTGIELDEWRRQRASFAAVPVEAPCHCVILETDAAGGTFVRQGEPLFSLAPPQNPDGTVEVDALVPLSRAAYLEVGQTASVALADRGAVAEGRVTALHFNADRLNRFGLPADRGMFSERALVTIALPAGSVQPAPAAGLPATVRVRIGVGALLRGILGTAFSVFNPFSAGAGTAAPHWQPPSAPSDTAS